MSKKPTYEQLAQRVKDLELEFVENKQTAEPLNKSSEYYRLLVERSRDVPYTVKPDGIINFIGPQIKHLGCSPEEVISKHYLDFVAPEQRQHIKQSFEQGTSLPTEFQWMGKDGSFYWVEAVGEIICDDSGNPVIQVGILHDISERRRALKKIEDSYHLLQTVIDTIEGEVFVKDNKGKYLFVNRAFASDFGVDSKEVIGKDDYFVFSHDTAAILQENDRRIMAAKKAENIEESTILRGEHVIYLTNKVPLIGEDGNVIGICGVGFDITRQKEIEKELKDVHLDLERKVKERTAQLTKTVDKLREAELRYRTVANFTYDWEYWQNPVGKFNYISPSCKRITGYSAEEFTVRPELLDQIILPEDRTIWSIHRQEALKVKKPIEVQFRIRKKDGEICWIEHTCQKIINNQGEFLGFRASNRDITLRKQSEDALRASRKEARMLAGKLITAQEAERKRLARELHDDIIQRMAFLNIEIDKLEIQHQTLSKTVKKRLRQIGNDLGELSTDIHMISRQLHPSILEDLGLVQTIETECKNFTRQRGIPVTLDLDGELQDLSKDISLCIYRILQEGLRNIARHARATDIQVILSKEDDALNFMVKDNGIGFDPASSIKNVGLGMANMRERAWLIQGDLSIESQPGKGTVIELRVPIASR